MSLAAYASDSTNKKGDFFLGFIGSEYDKHDLHQKSTSAIAREREETSNLSVQQSKNPVIGMDTTTIPLWIRPCLQGGS